MFKLANSHRSIRSFTSQDIDDSLLNELLMTGLRSSSSGNMQTWSVIVTRDEANKLDILPTLKLWGFLGSSSDRRNQFLSHIT